MDLQKNDFGLRPKDGFYVLRDFRLNSEHIELINRLFTPLIGSEATGLYIYLDQFANVPADTSPFTHYVFMSELKINLLEFRKIMDVLEAIGLIKTYVKHEAHHTHFVYELIQPPSAKQFFKDPMLSVFLYSEVNKERFNQLKRHFEVRQPIDIDSYREISRTYTDVFKIPSDKHFEVNTDKISNDKAYQGMNLRHVDFDFEALYDLLQSHFISSEIVSKDAKPLIIQLAALYGLSPESMKSIILKSITSAQTLSLEELRKHAQNYYRMEHEQQLPKIKMKKDLYQDAKEDSTDIQSTSENLAPGTDAWFELLENTSPIEMLASWSESEPTVAQKRLVEELVEREQLSFGVINVLLQFVMFKKDMQLPKSYILEIASNWKKVGIQTAKQAYDHGKKVHKNASKPKRTNSSSNKYVNLPARDMVPKWLEKQKQESSNKETSKTEKPKKDTEDKDERFLKDRNSFMEHLSKTWKGGRQS